MATATKRGRTWTAYWEVGRDAEGKRQQVTKGGFATKKAATLYGQEQERFLRAGGSTAELERGGVTWAAVWETARDAEDKLITATKGGFPTQDEAQAFAAKQWEQVRDGTFVPLDKCTVHDHLESWLTDYATPNTRPRTVHGYRGIFKRYVFPTVGPLELQKLTTDHIQRLYTTLLGKGLSARTVLHTHRVLKTALDAAVKTRKLSRNPADLVTPPRVTRTETAVLRPADVDRLLTAAEATDLGPLVVTALYTALRRSELCGLHWCDVDLDGAALSLTQTVQRVPGAGLAPHATKSHRSRRRVALSSEVVELLRRVRSSQRERCLAAGLPWQDTMPVFGRLAAKDGAVTMYPANPDILSRKFHRIVTSLGLDGLRLHDLRHAHASYMLMQGVHPSIVAERLGHANVSTTLNVYSHVLPGLQEQAAQAFEETMQRTRLTRGG